MPQDRISGADADRYGSETARLIAKAIGAISISETSNEFELDNSKITIRCARKNTQNLGAPYKLLERVSAVIAALEQENGDYKLYEITPAKFKEKMRPTGSTGPSAGRVGLVSKSLFINEGKFIREVKLNTEEKNKIWRMAFRCGNQGQSLWEECKKYNVAAITYSPLEKFDLTNHKYNEPVELWSKLSSSSQKSSLRHVAYDMKNGDTIYVKEGPKIICKGTVLGKPDRAYVFDQSFRIVDHNGTPWPHQVPVAWEASFEPVGVLLGAEQNAVLELNGERLSKLQKALSNNGAVGVENKIARICWNDHGWQRPSGRDGKSKNKDAYEFKVGYGHEEWLLDTEKLVDGYHYGYLQPIGKAWDKYQGQTFNISLYSINDDSRQRWWIGTIRNAEVVSPEESKEVLEYYKKKGWLQEMIDQIKNINGDERDFGKNAPFAFTNIKFKPADWELLDPPQRISNKDKSVSSTYYVLLNKVKNPDLELPFGDDPTFTPGHTIRDEKGIAYYGQRKSEIDRFHYKMQNNSYKQLVDMYGHDNVSTERQIGIGAAVDISVKDGDGEIFYEFKTSNSIKACIREALSQLLEYSYYPDTERAKKLIIVSQNPITKDAKNYLIKIREHFKIPVYYKQYNVDKNCLEEDEY
ncbi:MAG: hypothetical protein WC522_03905 [Candidatus Omnitrophota bacterium]